MFSRADLERSIPSMLDGLKPGQRKILFGCFKRNLTKDIKVSAATADIHMHQCPPALSSWRLIAKIASLLLDFQQNVAVCSRCACDLEKLER